MPAKDVAAVDGPGERWFRFEVAEEKSLLLIAVLRLHGVESGDWFWGHAGPGMRYIYLRSEDRAQRVADYLAAIEPDAEDALGLDNVPNAGIF